MKLISLCLLGAMAALTNAAVIEPLKRDACFESTIDIYYPYTSMHAYSNG
jgi:hypothetical protein